MADKNNGKWTDRVAVQKAFDRDPQHAYNVVNQVVNKQQAELIEANLVPQPSKDEQVAALEAVKATLEKHGLDTEAVQEKIAEIVAG